MSKDRNTLPSKREANLNEMVEFIKDVSESRDRLVRSPESHGTGKTTKVLQQLLDTVMKSNPGKTFLMLGVTQRQAVSISKIYLEEMLSNRQIPFKCTASKIMVNNCLIYFRSKKQCGQSKEFINMHPVSKVFVDHTVLEVIVAEGLNKIADQLKEFSGE